MHHLKAEGLGRRFGRLEVFKDIDLDVGTLDRVVLTGPNGSGKTTLLRVLAGVIPPSAGSVASTGSVAYLPQTAPVFPELTPVEQLCWWARLYGVTVDRSDALELAAASGLARHAAAPAGRLSRGQRQRLAIACTFLSGAAVLLLDEPYAALDEAGHRWLDDRIRTSRGAVVAAVHDPGRVSGLFDRRLEMVGP